MRQMDFDEFMEQDSGMVDGRNSNKQNSGQCGSTEEERGVSFSDEKLKDLQRKRHEQELRDEQRAREFVEFQKYQKMKQKQEREERRRASELGESSYQDDTPNYYDENMYKGTDYEESFRKFSTGNVLKGDDRPPTNTGNKISVGGAENLKLIYKLAIGVLAVLAVVFIAKGSPSLMALAILFLVMTFMGGMKSSGGN